MSMFTLSRHCARNSTGVFRRYFAEVVPANPTLKGVVDPPPPARLASPDGEESLPSTSTQATPAVRLGNRVPVREDHGLYSFFRIRQPGKDEKPFVGETQYETVGGGMAQENVQSGRGWKASELRLKSFHDLHTLWYVLLRERNLLATQQEETRRLGVPPLLSNLSYKKKQVRKSMARIKYVLNERRLAYEGAVQLAEKEKEDNLDQVVLQHQLAEYKKERKLLAKRRAERAQHLGTDNDSSSPSGSASAGLFGQTQ